MAPPNRRSGHSRRAQYSIFTAYVVAGLGALAGALLLIVSLLHPSAFSGLRGAATDATAPAGQAVAAGREGRQGLFAAIGAYIDAGSKNAALEHELRIARVRLAEARAVKAENAKLKALLKLAGEDPEPVAITRLIGSTASGVRRYAFIGKGRSDGVEPGMPVLSPTGLVGRVLEAGSSTARVLLVTDAGSMVPVRRAGDDVVAFAEGKPDGTVRLRLINLGINPLKKNDVFVTSGAGGIFRPGIAVAVVTETTRDGANGRVLGDPLATSFVTVEPAWQSKAEEMLATPAEEPAA